MNWRWTIKGRNNDHLYGFGLINQAHSCDNYYIIYCFQLQTLPSILCFVRPGSELCKSLFCSATWLSIKPCQLQVLEEGGFASPICVLFRSMSHPSSFFHWQQLLLLVAAVESRSLFFFFFLTVVELHLAFLSWRDSSTGRAEPPTSEVRVSALQEPLLYISKC